jgi:hypothetical protein
MSDAERADITNAIWLCRTCHKMVDTDRARYPAEVLFEWRRAHESEITRRLGKTGDTIRLKFAQREVAGFDSCSYLAQQIVLDKPRFWEHKLTIELLRSGLVPVIDRWASLEKGLYTKAVNIVSADRAMDWFVARMDEIQSIVHAFGCLANEEFVRSWGPPGEPGNPQEIMRVCRLAIGCAERIIEWEECVRFVTLPTELAGLHHLLRGIAGRILQQFERIPEELSVPFASESPSGEYHIQLAIDLPDGWSEKVDLELSRIRRLGRFYRS